MDVLRKGTKDARLLLYVATGTLFGMAFVAFDLVAEARIGAGTLRGAMSRAHAIVDHVLPIAAGALLGVCAHYLRLRQRLDAAEGQAARAEALRVRLQKVERDQAVWVLAAAILHEVNNPLHALGLLLDEVATAPNDTTLKTELLERARTQSERALTALSRLRALRTAGEPRCRSVQLDRVLTALAADASALAAEDGLEVHVDCRAPIRASADPTFVRTIMENLIHNSLQSLRGRGGGRLQIALAAEFSHAIVLVSDDGPPLDPATAAAIFTPLVSTKHNGLGLGLPIARALARAMRGDLRLDDLERKTFRLELPLGSAS
jgi:signal transduction histidine kinase